MRGFIPAEHTLWKASTLNIYYSYNESGEVLAEVFKSSQDVLKDLQFNSNMLFISDENYLKSVCRTYRSLNKIVVVDDLLDVLRLVGADRNNDSNKSHMHGVVENFITILLP